MRTVLNDFKDVVEVRTLNHGHINLDRGSREAKVTRDFMTEVAASLKAGKLLHSNDDARGRVLMGLQERSSNYHSSRTSSRILKKQRTSGARPSTVFGRLVMWP